jgi:hypothetical protein
MLDQNSKTDSRKIINQMEFRFAGLSRSGNHAVIDWLLSQCKGKKIFLNSIKRCDANPYFSIDYTTPDISKEINNLSPKKCLVYSYENFELKDIFSENFEKNHDAYLGKSLDRYDTLLLRDAFNFFASFIAGETANHLSWHLNHDKKSLQKDIKKQKRLWKAYAREYLGETNFLKHNKTIINYNQWFTDKKYRQELAKKFSLKFNDKSLNTVSMVSSFEKNMVYGKTGARKMKVLERWKNLVHNALYRDIFADRELVELSIKIFGKIPGAEILSANKSQRIKYFIFLKNKISLRLRREK